PLVARRCAALAFYHDFGLGAALLDIPQLVLHVGRDVVYPVGLLTKIFRLEVFVQQRRTSSTSWGISSRASPRPKSWSNASSAPRRSTRGISSRRTPRPSGIRTAECTSGAAHRGLSSSGILRRAFSTFPSPT